MDIPALVGWGGPIKTTAKKRGLHPVCIIPRCFVIGKFVILRNDKIFL